jgi:serine phosphatase RsbU (regulator of sigma subunit)
VPDRVRTAGEEAIILVPGVRLRWHAAPAVALVAVAVLDVLAGPGQVVLGLTVIAPFLAAINLGRRSTVGYAVLALVVAALLGVYNDQYRPDQLFAQMVRLTGVGLGGVAGVLACDARMRREERIAEQERARAADLQVQQLATTLQRSLLTDPPPLGRLTSAVRYLPAAAHAEIGGDWYDAFPLPDGRTAAIIGDVVGHDGPAAATMAHLRNLLRGIAQTGHPTPSGLLTDLDLALRRLSVPGMATLVIATLEPGPTATAVRWSNAGHPPPVLVRSDGTTVVLDSDPELLIGLVPERPRSDHDAAVGAGDTVLLYTDGLVERRGSDIDAGLARLVDAAGRHAGLPLDEFCDRILDEMAPAGDDDVALLALRSRGA